MPSPKPRARHAAPRQPVLQRRSTMLPGTLLVTAGVAFAGLAVLPAAADEPPSQVAASTVVPLAQPEPDQANADLGAALSQGLDTANRQAAAARRSASAAASAAASPRAAARASRSRSVAAFVRPGLGPETSGFGMRWGRLHAGVDLAAGIGSPIVAVEAGTVISAQMEGGYGRCVRIQDADGTVSVYGHLSAFVAEAGQQVAAGDLIGREGNSGHSTGPHLHFEIRVDGVPIDPVPWLEAHGITV